MGLSLDPPLNFGEGCAPSKKKKVNTAKKSPTKLKMLLLKLNVEGVCTMENTLRKMSHVGDSSELFGQGHRKPNCKEFTLSSIWFQVAVVSIFSKKRCVTHNTSPFAMRGL